MSDHASELAAWRERATRAHTARTMGNLRLRAQKLRRAPEPPSVEYDGVSLPRDEDESQERDECH